MIICSSSLLKRTCLESQPCMFLVIKQYTLSLSMVQHFYFIYCLPVDIYELVSHQATVDFFFSFVCTVRDGLIHHIAYAPETRENLGREEHMTQGMTGGRMEV